MLSHEKAQPIQHQTSQSWNLFRRQPSPLGSWVDMHWAPARGNTFPRRRFASQMKPLQERHPERSEGSLAGQRSLAALRMTKPDGLFFAMYFLQEAPCELRAVAETHRVKRGIFAISLQKLCMRTLLYNLTGLQHNNAIGSLNGREAMSDNQSRTSV